MASWVCKPSGDKTRPRHARRSSMGRMGRRSIRDGGSCCRPSFDARSSARAVCRVLSANQADNWLLHARVTVVRKWIVNMIHSQADRAITPHLCLFSLPTCWRNLPACLICLAYSGRNFSARVVLDDRLLRLQHRAYTSPSREPQQLRTMARPSVSSETCPRQFASQRCARAVNVR